MSHFQNKNKVWISNTLKTNNETLGIIKLLKDLGLFREKTKRRKPKKPAKEEEEVVDDEEFLVPPTGGGGGGGVGASVGLLPPSYATQALQALKSGASSQAQQQYLLENTKEQAQLALGRLRDEQQDYTAKQQRLGFGLEPSIPRIDFLEEETGTQFFPVKESVVSEPSQEFRQETSGTDVPSDVMNIDVSAKVGDQGQFEDDNEEFIMQPKAAARTGEKTLDEIIEEQIAEQTSESEKFAYLADQYGLKGLSSQAQLPEMKKYLLNLYTTFQLKAPRTAIAKMRKEEIKSKIKALISEQYKAITS
jgi:hypothetical protein